MLLTFSFSSRVQNLLIQVLEPITGDVTLVLSDFFTKMAEKDMEFLLSR